MPARLLLHRIAPALARFHAAIGLPGDDPTDSLAPVDERVPHTHLRLVLQADPALDALLPGLTGHVALGDRADAPFRVRTRTVVSLPPALLDDPGAAAIAARWGLEVVHALDGGARPTDRIPGLLRHGAHLLAHATPAARARLVALLPPDIAGALQHPDGPWTDAARRWLLSCVDGLTPPDEWPGDPPPSELELPLEALLVAGGDSRLILDPATGLNRYGVCPRPRPEAVHFSSSTASAISAHGFLWADVVRRGLLARQRAGVSPIALRRAMTDATADTLRELLALDPDEADTILAPSGTDTELLAVLLALAGRPDAPLRNVVVSPEESGRGVVLAGSGTFFDPVAATCAPITRGAPAFPGRHVTVVELPIRDDALRVLPPDVMRDAWLAAVRDGLAAGDHVLAHALVGSKTGLTAPDPLDMETALRAEGLRVDRVADACQLRAPGAALGQLVRAGWMVQITGSKFLTGPPFSGALVVPRAMRDRAATVATLLGEAPGVSVPDDWPSEWTRAMKLDDRGGSFGALFRWLPAWIEDRLHARLDPDARARALDRFRDAMRGRVDASPWVAPLEDALDERAADDMGRLSILAFQVRGARADGTTRPLDERECQWLFEQLNRDMSDRCPDVDPDGRALARLPCHFGQPVVLRGATRSVAFLRLVLGARFFNFVGHAPPGAADAALESEIADAGRVLDKVDWIAANWSRFEPLVPRPGTAAPTPTVEETARP